MKLDHYFTNAQKLTPSGSKLGMQDLKPKNAYKKTQAVGNLLGIGLEDDFWIRLQKQRQQKKT